MASKRSWKSCLKLQLRFFEQVPLLRRVFPGIRSIGIDFPIT
jgi:hypothetical protein